MEKNNKLIGIILAGLIGVIGGYFINTNSVSVDAPDQTGGVANTSISNTQELSILSNTALAGEDIIYDTARFVFAKGLLSSLSLSQSPLVTGYDFPIVVGNGTGGTTDLQNVSCKYHDGWVLGNGTFNGTSNTTYPPGTSWVITGPNGWTLSCTYGAIIP